MLQDGSKSTIAWRIVSSTQIVPGHPAIILAAVDADYANTRRATVCNRTPFIVARQICIEALLQISAFADVNGRPGAAGSGLAKDIDTGNAIKG